MASWKPWRALRERAHLDYALVELPAGCGRAFIASDGEQRVICIDRRLSPAERLCVLAHELVHDERGHSGHRPDLPSALEAVVAREEQRVDAIVAERLVPVDELTAMVAARAQLGEPVEVWEVAEHFGVDEPTAERALRRLVA